MRDSGLQQLLVELEDPTLVNDWDEEVGDRMIKVVFIGHDMDKEAIIESLDKCLAY